MNSFIPKKLRGKLLGRGFTLIETSAALSAMMVVGLALVALTNQHIALLSVFTKQSFLTVEAPTIGNLLGRLFSQADHFFVYQNRASALAGDAPVLSGGSAVRLFFPTVNGAALERWVTAEQVGSIYQLKCYSIHLDGTESSWIITSKLAGASFGSDQGILSALLKGPNGEEISYYGGSK